MIYHKRNKIPVWSVLFTSLLFFFPPSVIAQPMSKAAISIASDLARGLKASAPGVIAILPLKNSNDQHKAFEIRFAELIQNAIKKDLSSKHRLADQYSIKKVYEYRQRHGSQDKGDIELFQELFDDAAAEIFVTGSYVISNSGKFAEINYRAVRSSKVIATASPIKIDPGEIFHTGNRTLVLVKPKGIIGAAAGRPALDLVSMRTTYYLNKKGLNVIEISKKIIRKNENVKDIAKQNDISIVVLLDVEGSKQYTDYGNILGDASVGAKLIKMPEGNTVKSISGNMQVGSVVGTTDDPVHRAVRIVIDNIGPNIAIEIERLYAK